MSDQDLFTPVTTDQVDPNKSYLEELVGEGKKYKDLEALAKGAVHKDQYINTLETENKVYRTDLERGKRIEDLMEKLNSIHTTQSVNSDGNHSGRESDIQGPALTAEQLRTLAREEAKHLFDSARREKNLEEVAKRAREKLGPNFAARLNQQAADLRMDTKMLEAMAGDNPQAFYRLMGLDSTSGTSTNPYPSSVNTVALSSNQEPKKDPIVVRDSKGNPRWTPAEQMAIHEREFKKASEMGLEKYLASNQ